MRKLFHPTRKEIWKQVSAEIGARYVEGSFWKGDKVTARHGDWTIILDKYFCAASKLTYTRVRAAFVNPDDFRFTIYRRGLFSDIAKWFGMQDVEIGEAAFDRMFIIKGNDESRLRSLFTRKRIRELISQQPRIHLTAQKKKAGRNDTVFATHELRFHAVGVIKDMGRLKLLFELFSEVLDQLSRMAAANSAHRNRTFEKVGI